MAQITSKGGEWEKSNACCLTGIKILAKKNVAFFFPTFSKTISVVKQSIVRAEPK